MAAPWRPLTCTGLHAQLLAREPAPARARLSRSASPAATSLVMHTTQGQRDSGDRAKGGRCLTWTARQARVMRTPASTAMLSSCTSWPLGALCGACVLLRALATHAPHRAMTPRFECPDDVVCVHDLTRLAVTASDKGVSVKAKACKLLGG